MSRPTDPSAFGGRELTPAERDQLRVELAAIREERREQIAMLDVLARFRRGEYPRSRARR